MSKSGPLLRARQSIRQGFLGCGERGDRSSVPLPMALTVRYKFALNVFFGGLIVAATYVFYSIPGIYYLTNDDLGMEQMLLGVGGFAQPSTDLFFTSRIWGWFLSLLPSVGQLSGYSLGFVLLTGVCCSIQFSLLRWCRVPLMVAILITLLVATLPIASPQFTILTALVALTSIFMYFVASEYSDGLASNALYFGSLVLLFWALCIRFEMAISVALVASPFIVFPVWKKLCSKKNLAWIGAAVAAVILSYLIHEIPRGEEWQKALEYQKVRTWLLDFKGADVLLADRDLMESDGISENDIRLIKSWAGFDPRVYENPTLVEAINQRGTIFQNSFDFSKILVTLEELASRPHINSIFLLAMLVALLAVGTDMRALLAFSAAVFLTAALIHIERGAITRVVWGLYVVPMLFGFVVMMKRQRSGAYVFGLSWLRCFVSSFWVHRSWRVAYETSIARERGRGRELGLGWWLPILLLYGVLTSMEDAHFANATKAESMIEYSAWLKENEHLLDHYVTWGSTFRIENLRPMLTRSGVRWEEWPRYYGFGWSTHFPASRSAMDAEVGMGIIDRLVGDGLVFLKRRSINMNLIRIYCMEHHQMNFEQEQLSQYQGIELVVAACVTGEVGSGVLEKVNTGLFRRSSVRPFQIERHHRKLVDLSSNADSF